MAEGIGRVEEGPWFDLPDSAYAESAKALSNRPELLQAAAQFRETGYLIRDFGFSDADLNEAAAFTRAAPGARVQDGWLVNSSVRNLATHPSVLAFLDDLYQRASFPFQTLNFPKGTQQRTHSDTFHFNSKPGGFMCGVWIALEDIHPDSGPLQYYPGSQKLPVFAVEDVGQPYSMTAYENLVQKTVETAGLRAETAPIRRGQAFIWASNLFHGGSPQANLSRTRLSQVTHYYFRGCSWFTPQLAAGELAALGFWRDPYDIARRQFPGNAHTEARAHWRYRVSERMRIWRKRASYG